MLTQYSSPQVVTSLLYIAAVLTRAKSIVANRAMSNFRHLLDKRSPLLYTLRRARVSNQLLPPLPPHGGSVMYPNEILFRARRAVVPLCCCESKTFSPMQPAHKHNWSALGRVRLRAGMVQQCV